MATTDVQRIMTAIEVNGTRLRGPLDLTVTSSNDLTADTWSCRLVLADLPAGFGWGFWGRTASVEVNILVSAVPATTTAPSFQSLVIGCVDDVDVDAVHGVLHLNGRDRTARLLESRTAETFQNQTSSAVVTMLAQRHGLIAQVTPTSARIGQYYDQDHVGLNEHATEWDLLSFLARQEGFDLFIEGGTLYFQPATANTVQPHVLQYVPDGQGGIKSATVFDLKCQRSLLLSVGVSVQVVSWNNKQKREFTAQANSPATGSGGEPQVYTYRVPGLTYPQALQLAQQKLDDLSRHERSISWTEPGSLTLTPRTPVRLTGTGTEWDQGYAIDRIRRRISVKKGFTMDVSAKGASPPQVAAAVAKLA